MNGGQHGLSPLSGLIDEYRRLIHAASPEEERQIGIFHLEEPCQIVDHWIRPLDWHLVAIVHSQKAPDRFLHRVGPLALDEVYEAFPRVLDLDLWNGEVTADLDEFVPKHVSVPPGTRPRLRDFHKEALARFFQVLQYYAFRKPPTNGLGNASRQAPELSYFEWWGPLDALNPTALIEHEIAQAKHGYAQRLAAVPQGHQRPPAPETRPREEWDGCWTHLYPPLAIEPLREPNLFELISRQRRVPFNRPWHEFREALGGRIIYTSEGFVGVRGRDISAATRLVNLVSFLLTRDGLRCHFSGPNDFGMFREAKESLHSGRFTAMQLPHDDERLAADPFWRRTDPFGRMTELRHVSADGFEVILQEAERLEASDLSGEVVLVHEAETLLERRMFSHGLLIAWFAVERLLNRRLGRHLVAKGEPKPVLDHFKKQGVSAVIRILGQIDPTLVPNAELLYRVKRTRDGLAHRADRVEDSDATSGVTEARRMLEVSMAERPRP